MPFLFQCNAKFFIKKRECFNGVFLYENFVILRNCIEIKAISEIFQWKIHKNRIKQKNQFPQKKKIHKISKFLKNFEQFSFFFKTIELKLFRINFATILIALHWKENVLKTNDLEKTSLISFLFKEWKLFLYNFQFF